MCCGNCSVRENFLAKFEGYPAIIGIINIKQIPVLVFEIYKNMLKLKNIFSVNFSIKCNLDLQEGNGLHGFCTL